ncbi:MAG TPA: MHYT domain-containing protein [Rhizomicrobium sp.]|nr:MHYT domain-containing protein [Rhizomicrobium sp.]
MFRVIDCVFEEHDLRLVLLAGVLCLFACITAMGLAGRARVASGRAQLLWISGAGFVAGCGIWATHFVAMLAYQSGFPIDYNLTLTVLSVVIAIALCGGGFALAIRGGQPFAGGALTGSAIGIMHYVGMAAVRAPAREVWDFWYVGVSLVIGILAMAFGMRLVVRRRDMRSYMIGAGIFTLAICSMHFTGMAAVTFHYDPTVAATPGLLAPDVLAIAIASVAALILGLGMVTAVVDHHLADRAAGEATRLRSHIAALEATKAELEKSLRERAIALTKADAASKSKSAFLAAMSHELRTPLNAIIGFSEMMSLQAFGPLGSPQYQNYSRDIHESGKHLLALISDILDISRLEAGKADLHEESVHVGQLVRDSIRMVEHQAKQNGIALKSDVPMDTPRVLADERRLKQVMLNLLSNAVKFTQEGGAVTLRVATTGEGMFLSVEDSGIGIAPEDLARAFESFSQIDSTIARHKEGAGLGLPLSRQLMEAHGGTLTLESVVSIGTIATAMLPASRILALSRSAAA